MAYNFDRTPNRRSPHALNKWTWYPKDVLPMWVADMDLQTPPPILNALLKQVKHGVLGYELPSRSLYEVVATRMKKLYDWNVDPESIVYIPGVNNGYNTAARILCSAKKGFLIQSPVFNEFYDTAYKTGFRHWAAQLDEEIKGNRISYQVDIGVFKKNLKKVNMFLLCHPHNPIGKIYSPVELKQMAEICVENGVTIVSDEIHSELLLGGAKFTPLASLSSEIAQHTITLISAAKAFNVAGLACAFAIIPNDELRKRFSDAGQGMSFGISTAGLTAARIAFSGQADSWLKALRSYLTANRDFIIEYVERNLPGVRMTQPEATYLLWLDFSELRLEPSPFEFFLKEAKVAFSDGKVFGADCAQFVRLNFGTTRRIVEDGLARISKALRS